jgi:hypothetical protein
VEKLAGVQGGTHQKKFQPSNAHTGKERTMASVILRKEDLTPYALSLGIWETLTEGLPNEPESVEVKTIRNAD